MRVSKALWLGFGSVALLVMACVSPPTDDEVKLAMRAAADGVQELGPRPRFVVLNVQSKMEAWTHVAESAAEGPSRKAQALGRNFSKGSSRRVGVVIGGPQQSYVDKMILDAFESSGTQKLSGLTLVVVTPEPPTEVLRGAAMRRDVKLVYRPLQL